MTCNTDEFSIYQFDVKQPDFDWESTCWQHKSWSARFRDIRDALKDAWAANYVDSLRLLSVACTHQLTDRVVSLYCRPGRGKAWTREEVIQNFLAGKPTPARLRESIMHEDSAAVRGITNAAESLKRSLIEAGLLTLSGKAVDVSQTGVRFSKQALSKGMTRAEVEALLGRVLSRVKAFNCDDNNLYQITLVAVFGSYLDREITIFGDLDIAFAFGRRVVPEGLTDWDAWFAQQYKQRYGEPYSVILEMHHNFRRYQQLTEGVVRRALRANQRVSLHNIRQEGLFRTTPQLHARVVYESGYRVSRETTAGALVELCMSCQ